MITARQAVENIAAYLRDLSRFVPNEDLRLEEIEVGEDEKIWNVVLSYSVGTNLMGDAERVYKLFQVDNDTGRVKSMKNAPL